MRWQKGQSGNPKGRRPGTGKPLTFEDIKNKFFSLVEPEPTSGCWLWTAGRSSSNAGYGLFAPSKRFHIGAHVMSWLLHYGPVVGWILHRCDVRSCVNPAHLFVGDGQANVLDALAKKRLKSHPFCCGEQNPRATLTSALVREIRRQHAEGRSRRAIYEDLRLTRGAVGNVITGRTWSALPVENGPPDGGGGTQATGGGGGGGVKP